MLLNKERHINVPLIESISLLKSTFWRSIGRHRPSMVSKPISTVCTIIPKMVLCILARYIIPCIIWGIGIRP